jgi:hypothetical protein
MKSNTNNNDNSSSSRHFIQHIIDRTIGTLSSLSSTKIANVINPAITPDILPKNFQIPKQSRRILDSNTMRSTSEQQDQEYVPNVYDEYKDKRRIRKTEPSSRKSSDTTVSLPNTATNIQQDDNNSSPKITPNSISSSPENKKIDDKLKDQKEISSSNNNSINNIKPAEKGLQESPPSFFRPSSSPAIANKSNIQKKENDNNDDNKSYYTKINHNNNNKTVSSPQNQRSNEAIKESLPSPKTVKEQQPPHKDLPVFSSIKNKSKEDEKKFQQSSSKNQEDKKKLLSSAIERIIIKPLEQSQISEAAKFGKKERIPSAPNNNNNNNNKNDKSSSLTPINQLHPSSSSFSFGTNQSKDTISYEIKPTKPNIDTHKVNLEPIITINIGRIEVRAFVPPSKSPSVASTKLQPVQFSYILSLKDYLAQRAAGRS